MNTKKPLIELIPELVPYIQTRYADNVQYNSKLMDIYEGQLLPYIEESMQKELSPEAFTRAKGRISPINLCKQVIGKLSRVYIDPATRNTEVNTDGILLDKYEAWYDLDNKLAFANEMLNLTKYCALEPYLSEGIPGIRVISADKFLVWSDNHIIPDEPTVFIKFSGTIYKESPAVDAQGRAVKNGSKIVRSVQKFTLYSQTEIVEIDMDGEVLSTKINPYNKIPFVYIKNSNTDLIPKPDTDLFSMTLLIPKLLSDVNYAIQFMSHSIVYGIDVDPQSLSGNPDSFWVINSKDDGKTPSIGTIDPKVDSEKVINLIKSQVALWLDSKGLKTSSTGNVDSENPASGIAKLVDESDATAIRKSQAKLFSTAERELWKLTSLLHNSWAAQGAVLDERRAFTSKFNPSVTFSDQRPMVDMKSTISELEGLKTLGLFTPNRAIKALYPSLDDNQVSIILKEIEDYNNRGNDVSNQEE